MNSKSNVGWIVVGALIGIAVYKLIGHKHPDKNPWDVDSVLKACEDAAGKLEEIARTDVGSVRTAS